ncbi:MAG: B12-binding domain-containing radical SAM protein [Desulfuromonadaceae bacterium]
MVQSSAIHTGIASLAAVAVSRGVECCVFDTSSVPACDLVEAFSRKLAEWAPDILGISCFTQNWNMVKTLLSASLHDYPGTRPLTVIGGPHVSAAPDAVMSCADIDLAVLGEGEVPFTGIIGSLVSGGTFHDIPGILLRDGATVRRNPGPELVADLDALPYPDWGIFDASYLVAGTNCYNRQTVGVFNTSRGCPYRCRYCQNDIYQQLYSDTRNFHREQSAERVVAEIEDKLARYDFSLVVFMDETFVVNLDRLEVIAEAYKKRINLPCIVQTHPNTFSHRGMKLLKEMGVIEVKVGLECGNEDYRKRVLGRDTPNHRLMQQFQIARDYGIPIHTTNIIGLPFETREMIIETIELNRMLQVDRTCVNVYQPLPGTRLYDLCVEHKLLSGDDPSDLRFGADQTVIKTLVSQQELYELKSMFPNVL